MTEPALPPLPDQLFVMDRAHNTGEFLDLLLTLCAFGVNVALLLVDRGVAGATQEHRGIPVARFQDMGLKTLMVEVSGPEDAVTNLPDTVSLVTQEQVRALYRQVPRILHP
ncbi:MAG: hypothetical protein ACQERE_11005 [Pseudomonadota bacterium]